ncbi:hypothetical protein JXI42_11690 [bacterium]|nr:hypothetical protein [bacterium]
MVIWVIIIIILDVCVIVSIYSDLPASIIYLFACLILLTTIGILYRVFKKMRLGRFEKLETRAKKLVQENCELRLMDELQVKENKE